jgi:hypothetical protein
MWFNVVISVISGILLQERLFFIFAAVYLFAAIAFPEYPRHPRYRRTPEEKRAYRLHQRNLWRLENKRQWQNFTDIFLSKSAGYVLLRLSIIWIAICGLVGYLNS